jgi:hypothetical protein
MVLSSGVPNRIYALMTLKKKKSYEMIFERLKITFGLQPKNIMSDFENGIRAAAKSIFP